MAVTYIVNDDANFCDALAWLLPSHQLHSKQFGNVQDFEEVVAYEPLGRQP